nr:hypothetical protein [Porphyrostromium japonicum]
MEVLDPEFIDELSVSLRAADDNLFTAKSLPLLSSSFRLSNSIRLSCKHESILAPDIFIITRILFTFLLSRHWSRLLMVFFSSFTKDSDSNQSFSDSFLRKYRFYYRNKMHAYKVGQSYYEKDYILNSLGISYAYLLYLVSQQKDLYFFIEALYNFSPLQITPETHIFL